MIDTIAIGQADDTLKPEELKVTMRGKAEDLIAVLAHGLPREALQQLSDAIGQELAARRSGHSESREGK